MEVLSGQVSCCHNCTAESVVCVVVSAVVRCFLHGGVVFLGRDVGAAGHGDPTAMEVLLAAGGGAAN
jgi:hypothetical protein